MVNKKVVIICTVIAIIITSLIVAIEVKKFKTEDYYVAEEETSSVPQNIVQNQIENEVEDNNVVENENTEIENTNIEENIVEENNLPNSSYQGEEETKEDDTASQDYSSKALELAKKEWGEDDTVYFTIDNQSQNIFTISVRSKTTTQTLAEYEVNAIDETVSML